MAGKTIKMMQGDSYIVFIKLTVQGAPLTDKMCTDMEVSVGENLRLTRSGGRVAYDPTVEQWYFRPTQEETLDMEPDRYDVIVRVKFSENANADVKGIHVGRIIITDSISEEVI